MQRGKHAIADDLLAAARNSLLLGQLPIDALTALLEGAHTVRAARDESILKPYEDGVVLLVDGAALARTADSTGQFVVTSVLGPGEAWGLSDTLGHPDLLTEVEAATQTGALVFDGRTVRAAVEHRHEIALAFLRVAAMRLAAANEEVSLFANTSTTERVIERLLQLAERFGQAEGESLERMRLPVPLTQQDLASWARVSRESLARTLKMLRSNGIIDTYRRELTILDLPALEARRSGARPDPTIQRLLRSIAT